ncbi:ExbD/TolR family protein [Aeoliella mucimassa]|uniref:Biopolymer transport protein ExbD n=1 Tax=Aeoliella mucimassa TaxID=2527972 RepID=A0A518AMM6_9BACT|nr:biopolymer transporter ExbD [Aeoliella mucimassa]QDU55985.1 Biopolymer transport protein ExbD [Aeoliella mucimassa]
MPVQIKKGISASTLSLTPLIDVVFLLLIFFLVATRFEEEERSLAVNLPKASAAQPTMFEGKEIFVTINAEGDYFIEGKQFSAASLETELKNLYENNPGKQRVTIRADQDSRTANAVAVINACNKANIRDYNIATE